MNFFILTVTYVGERYHGSQHQKTQLSLEKELSDSLTLLLKTPIRVRFYSRTDRGVHALRARAYFSSNQEINQEKLLKSLNSILPVDVRVFALKKATESIIPEKKAKTYLYLIYNYEYFRTPFLHNRAYWVKEPLNIDFIKTSLPYLLGVKDFEYLSAAGSERKSTIRHLENIRVLKKGNIVYFFFRGDGFLYKMVRMIVALLIEIGKGKYPPEIIPEILEGIPFKRKVAPACGLYLLNN